MGGIILVTLVAGYFWFAGGAAQGFPEGMSQLDPQHTRMAQQKQRVARVRIAVSLTPFKKLAIKDRFGRVSETFKPTAEKKYNLRARIERPNHFYVGKWHIETIPLSWSRERQYLHMKLRFYKRYGDHKDLEEVIGSTEIRGPVKGERFLYNFLGRKSLNIKNQLGQPVVNIVLGPPPAPVVSATKPTKTPKSGKM